MPWTICKLDESEERKENLCELMWLIFFSFFGFGRHRSGRTARGAGKGKVTALVTKRDRVLAAAIEQAVLRGEPLDGLSSRKSDYQPGARFGVKPKAAKPKKFVPQQNRRAPAKRRS